MQTMALRQFIHMLKHDQREDRKFCFILGAGASRSSGIRVGWQLAEDWMKGIKERDGEQVAKQWMEENHVNEKDLGASYGAIYRERFRFDPGAGFSFLEKEMDRKEPSIGYSFLAQILATTPNNVVITTNFDSLTEDALFIHTDKKPLVIGHESLAGFIRPATMRPLIVKVHRGLYFNPKSNQEEIAAMDKAYKQSLRSIFETCIPLVIGYGGNDGSLMDYLKELEQVNGGMYWFHMPNEKLNDDIQSVLQRFNGFAIETNGFDDLMVQIGDALELSTTDKRIEEVAAKRAKDFREAYEQLVKNLSGDGKEALQEMAARPKLKTAWEYYIKAISEKDKNVQEQIYLDGLEVFPNDLVLCGGYAIFLYEDRKDYDKAEEYFLKALEADPSYSNNLGNYAMFLKDIRKDYDKAEDYYLKALEADPSHSNNLGNYALFLKNIRKDYDKAEEYFLKALKADPSHSNKLGNYANFLKDIRKDYDKAEQYYLKSLEANPNDSTHLANYSMFLLERGNLSKGQEKINQSFQNNPNPIEQLELHFYRYAAFWQEYPEARSEVERLLSEGTTSPDWLLDGVIARAEKLGHPNLKDLKQLAQRISAPEPPLA